jgi:hypothetical protein
MAFSQSGEVVKQEHNLIAELKHRNPLLYYFGLTNVVGAVVCVFLILNTDTQVLGINAFIKPMKFFVSLAALSFTMAWYMFLLKKQKAVSVYSWMTVIIMTFEQSVVVWQAANGRLSHFNISSPLYGLLFSLMGVGITIFTLWTLYIGVLFFRQKDYPSELPIGYIWGIRLGILFFVIFAFEGGQMAAQLAHTFGKHDGGIGLPVLNWSRQYGDLRVAHFFGMHALQVFPIIGYYIAKQKRSLFIFACGYFVFVAFLYWQAISGKPFLE